jgi:transposase-like protein
MPRSRSRRRRSESEWAEILRRFESSGLTVRAFCRRHDLSLSSFQRWRSWLGSVKRAEFVELVPTTAATPVAPTSAWWLEIALPNGVQLRLRG